MYNTQDITMTSPIKEASLITVIQWLPQDQIILHLLYIKLQEVEKIVEQLWKKHATSYSHWKLNVLLHMGKHHSYETPPNLPCFGKAEDCNKDKQKSLPSDSQKAQPTEISSSPSKRQGLRWECIELLSKWHASLEKGGITLQQHEKLKELSLVTFSSSYRTRFVSSKLLSTKCYKNKKH